MIIYDRARVLQERMGTAFLYFFRSRNTVPVSSRGPPRMSHIVWECHPGAPILPSLGPSPPPEAAVAKYCLLGSSDGQNTDPILANCISVMCIRGEGTLLQRQLEEEDRGREGWAQGKAALMGTD